jgi:hypothetical protein
VRPASTRDVADRLGERIQICHFNDNDGSGATKIHSRTTIRSSIASPFGYVVFGIPTVEDVARCVRIAVT